MPRRRSRRGGERDDRDEERMRTRGDRGRAAIEDARRSRTCGERDDRDAGDCDDRGRAANADDRDCRDGSFLRVSVAWPRNCPNLVLTGVVINDDFFLEFQAILSICPILCPFLPPGKNIDVSKNIFFPKCLLDVRVEVYRVWLM